MVVEGKVGCEICGIRGNVMEEEDTHNLQVCSFFFLFLFFFFPFQTLTHGVESLFHVPEKVGNWGLDWLIGGSKPMIRRGRRTKMGLIARS